MSKFIILDCRLIHQEAINHTLKTLSSFQSKSISIVKYVNCLDKHMLTIYNQRLKLIMNGDFGNFQAVISGGELKTNRFKVNSVF